jgi:hypothetical protein
VRADDLVFCAIAEAVTRRSRFFGRQQVLLGYKHTTLCFEGLKKRLEGRSEVSHSRLGAQLTKVTTISAGQTEGSVEERQVVKRCLVFLGWYKHTISSCGEALAARYDAGFLPAKVNMR